MLQGGNWDIDEDGMKSFGTFESSEKAIVVLGHTWLPPAVKLEGRRVFKRFLCLVWKKRRERPTVGGVSMRSSHGTLSRKECVSNVQMAKANNKRVLPAASILSNTVLQHFLGDGLF